MIEFKIFKNSNELPDNWDTLVLHDLFLKTVYLKALEKSSPNNISLYYVGFYNQSELIGVALIQRVQLYLNDIFRNHNDSCFTERFKNLVSKVLKGNILVVGNLTHTGQHGIYFNTDKRSYAEFLDALFKALSVLKDDIKSDFNKRVRAFLMKDFFIDDDINSNGNALNNFGFHKLTVQPNMVLEVKSNWKTFDDYISDLNKKYRDRFKSARKKAKPIVKKELTSEAVQNESEIFYNLYKNVSDNAKINTFILPENHFLEFKTHLDKSFKVFGYYLDEKLVGFYTLILNNTSLETYFLGYDSQYQYKNQLYLNMLYDMLQFGIENSFKNIIYARTAMAIKSSVGAKPKKMVMYLKHTNWLMNALLKVIFKLMNPNQDWDERHPFK